MYIHSRIFILLFTKVVQVMALHSSMAHLLANVENMSKQMPLEISHLNGRGWGGGPATRCEEVDVEVVSQSFLCHPQVRVNTATPEITVGVARSNGPKYLLPHLVHCFGGHRLQSLRLCVCVCFGSGY